MRKHISFDFDIPVRYNVHVSLCFNGKLYEHEIVHQLRVRSANGIEGDFFHLQVKGPRRILCRRRNITMSLEEPRRHHHSSRCNVPNTSRYYNKLQKLEIRKEHQSICSKCSANRSSTTSIMRLTHDHMNLFINMRKSSGVTPDRPQLRPQKCAVTCPTWCGNDKCASNLH